MALTYTTKRINDMLYKMFIGLIGTVLAIKLYLQSTAGHFCSLVSRLEYTS